MIVIEIECMSPITVSCLWKEYAMEEKIQVPIGEALLELTERAADNADEKSLLLIENVAHALLTTGVVISADEKSFYGISNYADALAGALSKGEPIEGIKDSALRP